MVKESLWKTLAHRVAPAWLRRRLRSTVSTTSGTLTVAGWLAVLLVAGPVFGLWISLLGEADLVQRTVTVFQRRGVTNMLTTTAIYTLGATILSTLAGTVLAWSLQTLRVGVATRLLPLVPLILPPLLGAVGWVLIMSPQAGYLNKALESFGLPVLDVVGLSGMIVVGAIYTTPYVYLPVSAALQNASLELQEAARLFGASYTRSVLGVLRNIWPAVATGAILSMIMTIGDFSVPLILGRPKGIEVLTTQIYRDMARYPQDLFAAQTFGAIGIVVALILVVIYSRVAGRADRFVTIGGKGGRRGLLPGSRWIAATVLGLYAVVAVGLPVLGLLLTSFASFWNGNIADLHLSLDNYRSMWQARGTSDAVVNSLVLAVGGATIGLVWVTLVGYLTSRARSLWARGLRYLSLIPIAVPAVILAVAIIVFLVRTPLYGTLWALLVGYLIHFFGQGVRLVEPAIVSIGLELEEAAAVAGAQRMRILRTVVAPLVRPALVGSWLIMFILMLRELSVSLLLHTPSTMVIGAQVFNLWENGLYPVVAAFSVMLVLVGVTALIATELVNVRATRSPSQPSVPTPDVTAGTTYEGAVST